MRAPPLTLNKSSLALFYGAAFFLAHTTAHPVDVLGDIDQVVFQPAPLDPWSSSSSSSSSPSKVLPLRDEQAGRRSEPRLVGSSVVPNSTFSLWYRRPADENNLEREGLVIGNGKLQVLVPGMVNRERLLLSEESCWTGGPNEYKEYRGGNVADERVPERLRSLEEVQRILAEKTYLPSKNNVAKGLMGDEHGFGHPAPLGSIVIEEMYPFEQIWDYRRELDLSRGLVNVTFSAGDVTYTREHFCSYPESLCVMRIRASEPKKVDISVRFDTTYEAEYTNIHNRLTFRSQIPSNNMTIEAQVALKTEGGTGVTLSDKNRIVALGFDSVTLYYTMGTGWSVTGYPEFQDQDPHSRLSSILDKATSQWYPDQLAKHTQDFEALYSGFYIDFNQPVSTVPTDQLVKLATKAFEEGETFEQEAYFELLLLQYARYLLIISSRPGSLPISSRIAWEDDTLKDEDDIGDYYRLNINLQMSYWLAENTGLGETVTPLMDYIEKLLFSRGQATAMLHHNARGWITHAYSNIWAHTGPTKVPGSFYFPGAAAWLCQHAWDRYLYSQDYYFLRDHAYKWLKEAAQFWVDTLVPSHHSGTEEFLVSSPSYYPEQDPFAEGSAFDQQLIWQLFNATLEAIAIVGERDKVFVQNLTDSYARLGSGLAISDGLLQEYTIAGLEDRTERRRHLGHLYAAYPGSQLFQQVDEDYTHQLVEAAKKSLQRRGDGVEFGDLGWPKIWRAAVWARLGETSKALGALQTFKRHNLKKDELNLLPSSSSLSRDLAGLLGYGAALLEVLVTSLKPGELHVFPSPQGLPTRWMEQGVIDGFRTREGHKVGVQWAQGRVTQVSLEAISKTGPMVVKIGTIGSEGAQIQVLQGTKPVEFQHDESLVRWEVSKGQIYTIIIQYQ
ncbi:hypothetical protein BGW41_002533 [Actinomortierella wolfii]|nr:hypothetical protein BGW41_002533 [Actinomortierella wolfii]